VLIDAAEVVGVFCTRKQRPVGRFRCFLLRAPTVGNCVLVADVAAGNIELSVAGTCPTHAALCG
jgi:hypothetical protein